MGIFFACGMHGPCTEFYASQMNEKYVLGVSKIFLIFKKYSHSILRTFLNKIFFHPMVFGHSARTNMAEEGPKLKNQWGSNKIENVHICLGNNHVHGEIQIQFFYFVPRPNNCKKCGSDFTINFVVHIHSQF